ncbi:hypothetical protein BRARA_B01464 [Brassica rapa]|uniref:DUF4283 domain-containing protein n=1 Tax=Brassica campestris TaxID=3711 RepID=A0A398A939_BRACM|nr:hypothetical protein BRARA_B01464 [Brassica rapa]
MDTETPKSKTLATENPTVPSSATNSSVPTETGKATATDKAPPPIATQQSPADLWKGFVKEASVKLSPKETPYILESGEKCVTIPNAVVEKNKKAWECFILGQFYEEAPARGAVHAIVNGIWSRQRRDITVNKMDGNVYLFRVPCPNARRRILSQNLWQIDGQTMFVAKWSPGIQQIKPELKMVPVWLELTGVPLQFFNKDALQEIAGLVGHPVCLHPATENLTNIEVAKVYTVIDPREPLPEFVNARFEGGDTRRIAVSCPWLPSRCEFCKKFGHTISRCKTAPRTCETCNSVKHATAACPRTNHLPPDLRKQKGKAPIKSLLPIVGQPKTVRKTKGTTPVETFETVASNYRGTGTQKNSAVVRSSSEQSDHTVSTHHDLSNGSLYVDLSADGKLPEQLPSSTSSSDSSLSADEDDPDDDSDEFIEFFSKRYQKRAKLKARAGGS